MIKRFKITVFLTLYVCSVFSINTISKDSISRLKHRFNIHHEFLSPIIYPLIIGGNSNNTKLKTWKYFTGGIGFKLNKKNELNIDYLYFEKQVYSTDPKENAPALFGSIVNPNFSYDAQNHIYKQFYLWLSLTHNFKNLFVSCGFGAGTYTYKNNDKYNAVYEKNRDWCNVIDFGYNFKLGKRFLLSPYIGMLNSFSYRKDIVYEKPVIYSETAIYNYEVQQFKDLKSVSIENSNTVIRRYKNLGIMQSKIIPRLGLKVTFNF